MKLIEFELDDPWDFEQVYGALHDFARGYDFDTEREDYLVHITTGTHVAQICMFLLTESHYFRPGSFKARRLRRGDAEGRAPSRSSIWTSRSTTVSPRAVSNSQESRLKK